MDCFQFTYEIMVIALIYIDRLLMDNPEIVLSYKNTKNITFIALTIAAKFFDDRFENCNLFS